MNDKDLINAMLEDDEIDEVTQRMFDAINSNGSSSMETARSGEQFKPLTKEEFGKVMEDVYQEDDKIDEALKGFISEDDGRNQKDDSYSEDNSNEQSME